MLKIDLDTVNKGQAPPLPEYEYDLGPKRFGPGSSTDITLPAEFSNQQDYKLIIKALKTISGLAYELKIPIALVGGFALKILGYGERQTKDLDIVTTEYGVEAITALVKEHHDRYCKKDRYEKVIGGLIEGPDGGSPLQYLTDEGKVRIDIDIMSLRRQWKARTTTEGILDQSVDVFDHQNYRVTKCATASDIYELKFAASNDSTRKQKSDLSDIIWLRKNRSKDLSEVQKSEAIPM
ncbi:hypothetical protein FOXG_10773 [Fusarium oxysporum f. sp. lycopersici 4287]|uniref:Uncharacterized protein n=3 Tax=Fusarium oxysporum TaxID=5507 RepID=A0A0J9WQE1_FUSO4|nr:hypothetical protein FOXG_10773 [Fusarium oxysporum f. sp. lycopersici 4287]EXK40845.1 hypothetical protein FOMG_07579 [Fusarium oxysporum f. sp. melonis 26406]KAJ9422722.1 hypothetical protein QL093DRAFT_2099754 [Fusarium oxysporum]KNB10622.1 hypothetical protein FOXG_10773 [Fusarium oxysporum f. sp. lycopersici 4287]